MKGGEELELPPGFRFHPTDEELVNYYLTAKCAGLPISVPVIADIDLYKYDPWQLLMECLALAEMSVYGEKEWYFFSPRDRKYPKGSRPNRAAGSGYWKATGADKPIGTMGIKKSLVFYAGKPPRGVKTNWIMHEYRPVNPHTSSSVPKENNLRLDDWVLCRVYNKKGRIEKHYPFQMEPHEIHTDTSSESKPWLQTTDSSCSDHVLSPEDTKELLSQPNWILNDAFDEFQLHYNGAQDDPLPINLGIRWTSHGLLQTMGIP